MSTQPVLSLVRTGGFHQVSRPVATASDLVTYNYLVLYLLSIVELSINKVRIRLELTL